MVGGGGCSSLFSAYKAHEIPVCGSGLCPLPCAHTPTLHTPEWHAQGHTAPQGQVPQTRGSTSTCTYTHVHTHGMCLHTSVHTPTRMCRHMYVHTLHSQRTCRHAVDGGCGWSGHCVYTHPIRPAGAPRSGQPFLCHFCAGSPIPGDP